MQSDTILILDFGSQYTQLIARKVRELNVYCEIHPYHFIQHPDFTTQKYKGIILSGSPFSVRQQKSPKPDMDIIRKKLPVLGVCYGAQLLTHHAGGEVAPSKIREYGRANLSFVNRNNPLFKNISDHSQVWMSHADTIAGMPSSFEVTASTADVKYAGFQIREEKTFGIQFHPEVYHTSEGLTLLKNFVVAICGCRQNWTPSSFINTTIDELRKKLSHDKVVMAL
ncbi:MAG TPA: glutamine-hydrolyzing GMP synthase, partial [Bacteroidia bacterium]